MGDVFVDPGRDLGTHFFICWFRFSFFLSLFLYTGVGIASCASSRYGCGCGGYAINMFSPLSSVTLNFVFLLFLFNFCYIFDFHAFPSYPP